MRSETEVRYANKRRNLFYIMAIWNEETEDQLISLIQERPALFDITEKRYASRAAKSGLWREIATQLGFPEKELRMKWDSLRTQHTRYRRLAPSGSCGAPTTGRQQWILTRLQFLEPYTRRRESTSNLTVTEPPVAAEPPPDGTSSETWTSTPEEPFLFEAESRPRTPLAEPTICGTESAPAPLREGPSTLRHLGTPRPRVKRSRKMLDESASEASETLMRTMGRTLEHLTSTGEHNDDIAAYSKTFEHRLRQVPQDRLPHFLHDVDNSFFKYLTGVFPLGDWSDEFLQHLKLNGEKPSTNVST
ncbi:uncharacterized protein LOC117547178 [Gymnodraco acuticeps]|uniref:Uncharacterized protein LOC117547178 n=1 Tax=Gymnodraco acuticeps TaxID=8218 RepID=A0A6P8V9E9_GYMAC|nr:uncharacterized protein LOC117547178 [Gymnodraco acuticeps]